MKKATLGAIALALCTTASATDLGDALQVAAREGRFSGTLTGPMADQMRQQLRLTGPIGLDVRVIHRFARPGCNRYQLDFRIPQPSGPAAFGMQMNLCPDGTAPADAASFRAPPPPGSTALTPEAVDRFFAQGTAAPKMPRTPSAEKAPTAR